MFERSFTAIAPPTSAAATVVGDFDIGRSDADRELELEASGTGNGIFVIFSGKLSSADCAGILASEGINRAEVLMGVQDAPICVGIDDTVRHLTVFLTNGPPVSVAVCTVTVRSKRYG